MKKHKYPFNFGTSLNSYPAGYKLLVSEYYQIPNELANELYIEIVGKSTVIKFQRDKYE